MLFILLIIQGLKAGDKLDWSLEARKNEITIVVRKVESSKKK
jgi:hypothetical protein